MKMHRHDSISSSRRNFLKTGPGATAGLLVSLNDLAAARQMIAVRKQEADILTVPPGEKEPNLRAAPHEADIPVAVPHVRWNDRGRSSSLPTGTRAVMPASHCESPSRRLACRDTLVARSPSFGPEARSRYMAKETWRPSLARSGGTRRKAEASAYSSSSPGGFLFHQTHKVTGERLRELIT
jgi:hypothetical protein